MVHIHKKIKDEWKLLSVILLVFVVLFAGFIALRRAVWYDEAIYIAMGKWFFSSGRFGLFDNLRAPMFPLWVGLLWKIGMNPRYAPIFFNAVFLMLSSIVLFKISKPMKRYAILVPAFFLINNLTIKFGSLALTEPLALLFMILAEYFLFKDKYWLFGLFSGLAFLTRFPFGLIFALGLLYEFIYSKRISRVLNPIKSSLSFTLVVLPYFVFNYFEYFGRIFYPFQNAVFTVGIAPKVGGPFYYVKTLLSTNILFALLPITLYAIFELIQKKRRSEEFRILLFNLVAFLSFFLYFTHLGHKETRYALAFLPFASFLAGYSIYFLVGKVKTSVFKQRQSVVRYSLLLIVILAGLIMPAGKLWLAIHDPIRTDLSYNHQLEFARQYVVSNLKNYSLNSSDIIITNDVSFSYYLDNKLVSIIFPYRSLRVLSMDKNKDGFVVLNTCDLTCFDSQCESAKQELMKTLSNYTFLFKTPKFYNCTYLVYKNYRS